MADDQDSSDHEDLFASPSKEAKAVQEPPRTPANQNTPFDAEEAREAALRKELEGVRSINESIEGLLETLERAKGNMGVYCLSHLHPISLQCHADGALLDCGQDCSECIYPVKYLDTHTVSNRTQPTPHSQPGMERRKPRSAGY
jgi:hypothetical protein